MKIGNVRIKGKVALAPLAGVTDIPFRMMCKEQGADVVFSEMVSSEGLVRGSEKTNKYLNFLECERPVALQLFGGNPEVMGQASAIVAERKPDIIDINFGCPVKKVVRNEAGSALLKDPQKMGKIVNAMIKSVPIPVTAKIRCGWDENSMPVSEIGKILEDNGAAAIAIHARTRQMQFEGRALWDQIRKLKDAVSIPIIGNGDVLNPEDARRMFAETGCDMVMIGRGAMGNPWIFKQVNHYLKEGNMLEQPSDVERIELCFRQMRLSYEFYGPTYTKNIMKKHIAWYVKGLPNGSVLKSKIFGAQDYQMMQSILREYFDQILRDNSGNTSSAYKKRKAG